MARILIVDDNPDLLQLLTTFFELRSDHEVLTARTGEDGLALAFEIPPDVAVIDVMMPHMDGYEVVRRLRDEPRTQDIGIIILTARGQPVDEVAAIRAGADMHLHKPVSSEFLLGAVGEVLAERSRAVSSLVVPIIGLRGGTGVTTVAVNLATLLQQVAPTVLWDVSAASGHAAIFLGVRPDTHWGLYLQEPTRDIAKLVQTHGSGLRILPAPPIPGAFGWRDREATAAILQELLDIARFIVVDMPRALDDTVHPVLAAASRAVLVTGDDPPSVQTTLATLKALGSWRGRVVLVRSGARVAKQMPIKALERALRVGIQVDLPHDPDQMVALRKGTPLVLAKPESPLAAALKRTAQHLLLDQR